MGGFPTNWDSDAREGLKIRAQNAIEDARDDPGEPVEVNEMGVSVTYDPDKMFPPTGIRGCWEITVERPSGAGDPRVYWRQDQEEAIELFRQSISVHIAHDFASPGETYAFVENLRMTGITGM